MEVYINKLQSKSIEELRKKYKLTVDKKKRQIIKKVITSKKKQEEVEQQKQFAELFTQNDDEEDPMAIFRREALKDFKNNRINERLNAESQDRLVKPSKKIMKPYADTADPTYTSPEHLGDEITSFSTFDKFN